MLELFELFFVIPAILILIFMVWLFYIPIKLAERQNLPPNKIRVIKILSYLGIITGGACWLIAFAIVLYEIYTQKG